jgi:hypothetical protein
MPMGILAPGSSHARPSAAPPPINMCGNFPALVSAETSPPTHQKSYSKFRNPKTTFENTPLCPPKYTIYIPKYTIYIPNYIDNGMLKGGAIQWLML